MAGVDHVGFTVSDLGKSIDFYKLLLQREPIGRRLYREPYLADIVGYRNLELDAAFFELPGSSMILELLEYHKPPAGRVDLETYNVGNGHLCLLTDDLTAEFNRLQSASVCFRSEMPVIIQAGPYKGGKAVYLRDPDGITIEIIERPRGGLVFAATGS